MSHPTIYVCKHSGKPQGNCDCDETCELIPLGRPPATDPLFKYDGDSRDRPLRLVWKQVDVPEGHDPLVVVCAEMDGVERPLLFLSQAAYEDEVFRAELATSLEGLLVREAQRSSPGTVLVPPAKGN